MNQNIKGIQFEYFTSFEMNLHSVLQHYTDRHRIKFSNEL
jgi:hypothetical protein